MAQLPVDLRIVHEAAPCVNGITDVSSNLPKGSCRAYQDSSSRRVVLGSFTYSEGVTALRRWINAHEDTARAGKSSDHLGMEKKAINGHERSSRRHSGVYPVISLRWWSGGVCLVGCRRVVQDKILSEKPHLARIDVHIECQPRPPSSLASTTIDNTLHIIIVSSKVSIDHVVAR